MHKNLSALLSLVTAILLAILVLGGFLPGFWVCDLLSQFRIPLSVVLVILLSGFIAIKNKILVAATFVLFIVNLAPVASMFLPASRTTLLKPTVLTILNFNTEFQHNDHYELFTELVKAKHPDLITLVEVNQKWIDALKDTTSSYPYKIIELKGAGMAVFSKYPLEGVSVWYFGHSHHPRISALVNTGSANINLLVVHPPTPQTETGYDERDRELAIIKNEISAASEPALLIGDLNCGPWANAFQRMLDAGIRDSEQGFGPQPSWPARVGRVVDKVSVPPLIPIDHLLLRGKVNVLSRETGPAIQSDHLPVFIKLEMGK